MRDIIDTKTDIEIKTSPKIPAGAIRLQIVSGAKSELLKEKGDSVVEKEKTKTTVSFYTGEKINADTYRSLGGIIAKWIKKNGIKTAALQIPADLNDRDHKALLEGLLLGSFSFDKYKKKEDPVDSVIYLDPSEEILLQTCKTVCDAVNMAREWAHEPAAIINPQTLSERAQKFAKQFGLNCKILDDKQLTEMGAGAIVAVGQGSKTPSRMIILEYKGTEKEKPVVLVGKALTFDSGGYSIKPGDSMVGMKYDKCGAMAVLGVLRAASQLKIATPIIGIICAAENMLSQNSYRPDDILISLSGKSIEVISTDAEGRLVLADGLTYAQQNFSPQAIIDLATLTGGCAVAYGHVRAGVLTNNQSLYRELFESGERTWERIWQLPNDEDYAKLIKGKDADIKNSGGRLASPVTGGMFLKEFISDEIPWAHLDIAGVADLDEGTDYSVPGATGFGVRLLIDWLSNRNQ